MTKPGQVVSDDQMKSSKPGLMVHLKGSFTHQRYKYATVFADHYSHYGFIYLQRTLSAKETLQIKRSFEAHYKHLHATVQHYHADNGQFLDNVWINDINTQQKTILFCEVSAHHQNRTAKNAYGILPRVLAR